MSISVEGNNISFSIDIAFVRNRTEVFSKSSITSLLPALKMLYVLTCGSLLLFVCCVLNAHCKHSSGIIHIYESGKAY